MTPTARTLDWLRRAGYTAEKVERINPFAGPPDKRCPVCGKNRIGKTVDLFGFIDVIAVGGGETGVLAVQSTAGGGSGDSNHYARARKILGIPAARVWIEAGNRIMVQSWKQPGGAGTRWQSRIETITIGQFEEPDAAQDEPEGLFKEAS